MPEQVSECPYCHGTFPHQGPTGCPPIKWPPDPKPRWRVTEWDTPEPDEYVYEVTGDAGRTVYVKRPSWEFVDPFKRPLPSENDRVEIEKVISAYALANDHVITG